MKEKFIQVIKNKWLKSIVLTLLLVGIIVCAYLAINYAVDKANITDIDMTKEKLYSISQETKDKLQNLDIDTTITLFNMSEYYKDFAYKYADLNEHIKVEELENLTSKADWKAEYGLQDTSAFIMISTADREKILYEYDLYTIDYTTYTEIDITEEAITNAILDVATTVKPKVYFLTGHNLYSSMYFQYLQSDLTNEANEVAEVDLMKSDKVPDDCSVLIITALSEDIEEIERDRLIDYINRGGKILLLSDSNLNNIKLDNFQKVLDEYGVSISDGIILEGDSSKMVSGAPNFVIATINSSSSIIKNANMDINVCLINTGKLDIASSEELEELNVTSEILASVSDKAFLRTDLTSNSQNKIESDEDAGGAPVAAMLTKEIDEDTSSKLIIFANTVFATNTQIAVSSQYYSYAMDFYNNRDVLLNSVSYLTDREETITIRKNLEAVNYDVTETQNRIVLTVIFSLPVLIIIIGIFVWIMRRRKK